MAIRVKFFASLREQLTEPLHEVEAADVHSVADVWATATGGASLPDNLLCSTNLELCHTTDRVQDGDEVAFFPPVTGG